MAASLFLFSCRDRTSFAPNVKPTPIPPFAFNGILATYNNPSMGHKETATLGLIEASSDRNSTEFPGSATAAFLSTQDGGGPIAGRALKVDFTLRDQAATYAGCNMSPPCDCPSAYAYLSLSHQFSPEGVPGLDLRSFTKLSFWVKATQNFTLKVSLACQGNARPFTYGPTGGYRDDAYTIKNPCWSGGKSEMTPAFKAVSGNGAWQKVEVSLLGLLDASTPSSDGVTAPCGLDRVKALNLVMEKSPTAIGPYPADSGTLYFDDVVLE